MFEIQVAKKYGLFWSGAIEEKSGSQLHGLYLYRPSYPFSPFVKVANKISELNDYIFTQLCSSEASFKDAKSDLTELRANEIVCPISKDVINSRVDLWDSNVNVTSRVVPIIMLTSFFEWVLNFYIDIYCEEQFDDKKVYKLKGDDPLKGKIGRLFKWLKVKADLPVEISEQFVLFLHKYRKTRNNFAHGNWDEIEVIDDGVIKEFLVHITKFLYMLEKELIVKYHTYG